MNNLNPFLYYCSTSKISLLFFYDSKKTSNWFKLGKILLLNKINLENLKMSEFKEILSKKALIQLELYPTILVNSERDKIH